ncbi:hypothetical protein [uncultured Pseudoteredinibacter sp.]|uniref:hypothetical protein n=1 Tax=uncultured Pseudoteredinibacter sp. TaxID=1641701 RepID=UPI002611B07B|nr:hypothetical protein [uncultured Pseudoteredinibacter sp.]
MRKTIPQSIWLLLLASVLLWGQIVNAQHIHLDHHAPHECMSCQQLKSFDGAVSKSISIECSFSSAAPESIELPKPQALVARKLKIRAPPSL